MIRRVLPALAATLGAAVVLTGCSSAVTLPPGPTQAQVKAVMAEQSRQWWDSIAPEQPMPVIDPVAYISPFGDAHELLDCIDEFGTGNQDTFERANFVCSQKYPYDFSDPEMIGLYSPEQLIYLYDYFATRLTPCLQSLGYTVVGQPQRDSFTDTYYLEWSPYFSLTPQPLTKSEWQRVDLRCPPPPLGTFWRPGIDYDVVP